MKKPLLRAAAVALMLAALSTTALAEPAVQVLGRDFVFPNRVPGLPGKLSEFAGLQINSFVTNDGVKLAYWEAGKGPPLIFVPGWSANGVKSADYVGHSMGAAILWSYIDLFGTGGIRKVAFVDEPISIYAHDDWSEKERSEAGWQHDLA